MDLCVFLNKIAFENMTCKLTYVLSLLNEPQSYIRLRGRREVDNLAQI